MSDHRPLERRRAPYPPSRGRARSPSFRTLPRLERAHHYGSAHGGLYVSARIPKAEHEAVLAAFEAHADGGYGKPALIDGEPFTESAFDTPRGAIRLVTSPEQDETYAYYDWEETP